MIPCPNILRAGLVCVLSLAAHPGMAESFSVTLSKVRLGTLSFDGAGTSARLQAKLANTPLGVFDGTYTGTSTRSAADATPTTEFSAISKSTRKSRSVEVIFSAGRALTTTVSPAAEETPLSDPAKAPNAVTDPVRAIGELVAAKTCPGRINIYDGRRAIALIPDGSTVEDSTLVCAVSYRVTAGPGHLSPLKISKAKMQLRYDMTSARSLQQITLRSGPFNLTLQRNN